MENPRRDGRGDSGFVARLVCVTRIKQGADRAFLGHSQARLIVRMLARLLDPSNAAPLGGLLARLVAGAGSHDLVDGPLLGGLVASPVGVAGVFDLPDAANPLRCRLLARLVVVAAVLHHLDGLEGVDVSPGVLAGRISPAPHVNDLDLGALTGLVRRAPVPHRREDGVPTRRLGRASPEDHADGGVLARVLALAAPLVLADRAREAVARLPPVAAPTAVAAGLLARLPAGGVAVDADDAVPRTLDGGRGGGGGGDRGGGDRGGGRRGGGRGGGGRCGSGRLVYGGGHLVGGGGVGGEGVGGGGSRRCGDCRLVYGGGIGGGGRRRRGVGRSGVGRLVFGGGVGGGGR